MSAGSKTFLRQLTLWPLRLLVAAALLILLATMARVPIGEAPQDGLLRLTWRNVGERVRLCRDYTEAEMQSLPQHMRRGQLCENSLLPYRLQVRIDGNERVDKVVHPGGARRDRPLFVAEDLPLAPGTYRLELDYAPEPKLAGERMASGDSFSDGLAQDALAAALQVAKHYRLEESIQVRAGHIVLISLNEDARALRIRGN